MDFSTFIDKVSLLKMDNLLPQEVSDVMAVRQWEYRGLRPNTRFYLLKVKDSSDATRPCDSRINFQNGLVQAAWNILDSPASGGRVREQITRHPYFNELNAVPEVEEMLADDGPVPNILLNEDEFWAFYEVPDVSKIQLDFYAEDFDYVALQLEAARRGGGKIGRPEDAEKPKKRSSGKLSSLGRRLGTRRDPFLLGKEFDMDTGSSDSGFSTEVDEEVEEGSELESEVSVPEETEEKEEDKATTKVSLVDSFSIFLPGLFLPHPGP